MVRTIIFTKGQKMNKGTIVVYLHAELNEEESKETVTALNNAGLVDAKCTGGVCEFRTTRPMNTAAIEKVLDTCVGDHLWSNFVRK